MRNKKPAKKPVNKATHAKMGEAYSRSVQYFEDTGECHYCETIDGDNGYFYHEKDCPLYDGTEPRYKKEDVDRLFALFNTDIARGPEDIDVDGIKKFLDKFKGSYGVGLILEVYPLLPHTMDELRNLFNNH